MDWRDNTPCDWALGIIGNTCDEAVYLCSGSLRLNRDGYDHVGKEIGDSRYRPISCPENAMECEVPEHSYPRYVGKMASRYTCTV